MRAPPPSRRSKETDTAPPIVVQDELASGKLVELARLDEIREVFCAVTIRRQFPNPLLSEVLSQEVGTEAR